MRRNVGRLDGYVRLATGAALTLMGIARLARGRSGWPAALMLMAGATKLAEGAVGYCPMLDLMSASTRRF